MAAYPTLARGIDIDTFEETKAFDPHISSQFEDGTLLTRARFTQTKMRFRYTHSYLTDADKTLLENLEDAVMVGGGSFDWTHPKSSMIYDVVLTRAIRFRPMSEDKNKWGASVELVEV